MNSHRREEMPMSRVLGGVVGATDLDRIWGTRPEFYALFMEDYGRSIGRVDPIIVELCRLRIAQMVESAFDLALRYAPATAAGLSEEKVAALADYPTSPLFTPREQACLEFTEQWVVQSSAISDDDVARLQEHLTPEEFIYFCKALSVLDQLARTNSAFRIEPAGTVPATLPHFTTAA
jgi:alkylhydroperoxidase family enzyme